ncbi:nitrogenase [Hydrococcus rivularis NIES-593]|uniref:Nitrogenase n=1 Tax=Hydrococcus rivularis NIES-593 TaxID=1921803 RepID=A0A1U7HLM4_9CYAN|nr:Mo-dependent nitrogenase C-terminal domain-containing protein [Hydrococcus rivularis]OKH24451.1 nitrogenase [Hydrococcus rivularis NIES-593]
MTSTTHPLIPNRKPSFDILYPVRRWIDGIEVKDAKFAHFICRVFPCNCPFERDIKLFGRTLFHIPPLCKLNPLYNEVVGLRFRALSYLSDTCGVDVTHYIC